MNKEIDLLYRILYDHRILLGNYPENTTSYTKSLAEEIIILCDLIERLEEEEQFSRRVNDIKKEIE